MKRSIKWYASDREELPEFTIGRGSIKKYFQKANDKLAITGTSGFTVGISQDESGQPFPALFVVSDEAYYDIFSWTSTFAPDAFPLSQFARVTLETDAKSLGEFLLKGGTNRSRSEQWSSIILGELLGQGGGDVDVSSVPYSRSAACFSTSIARTWILYDSEAAAANVAKRLRKIESDKRFVRRGVTLDSLEAIWEALTQLGDSLYGEKPDAIVELVCRAAKELYKNPSSAMSRLLSLDNFAGLQSTSIEERVVTFQRLASEINTIDAALHPWLGAIVAGSVFLVGRGTSHAFLLKRVPALFPLASAWFGLIATLSGPATWDSHWLRACKGIEKNLRQGFEWEEPALADLSWPEYNWMASVFDGYQVFEAVSRTVAKVLSIEVLPGAICQLRLAGSTEDIGEQTRGATKGARTSKKEKELELSIVQFLELARKIDSRLNLSHGSAWDEANASQSSLFKDDNMLSSKPPKKSRNPSY